MEYQRWSRLRKQLENMINVVYLFTLASLSTSSAQFYPLQPYVSADAQATSANTSSQTTSSPTIVKTGPPVIPTNPPTDPPTTTPSKASSHTNTSWVCPIDCFNNTVCVLGNQTTQGHATSPVNGSALNIHNQLNVDGYHCACPPGLTGLRCDTPYENCNDGVHICYNGGTCMPGLQDEYGNEQLFCNCNTASSQYNNSVRYSGKYCEEEIDLNVQNCGEGTVCMNGGTCNATSDPSHPCDCPAGFQGQNCEYVKGTVPDCNLTCLNGGFCRLGVPYGGVNKYSKGKYCQCPPDYYGDRCENKAELCGDDYCYHGSKCFEIRLSDGTIDYVCDCTAAYSTGRYYAGKFCQYPSTTFCTGANDPNGRQFCTNEGTCPKEAYGACDCLPGFSGPRCALKTDEADDYYAQCSLDCKNGGKCQKGRKEIGNGFLKYAKDIAALINKTHVNMEHCVCPDGFYGITCEYEAQRCPKGEHICFHGSECVMNGDEDRCNCESAQKKTAGLFCEFFATDTCPSGSKGQNSTHRGFCTNGGKCLVDDEGYVPCAFLDLFVTGTFLNSIIFGI